MATPLKDDFCVNLNNTNYEYSTQTQKFDWFTLHRTGFSFLFIFWGLYIRCRIYTLVTILNVRIWFHLNSVQSKLKYHVHLKQMEFILYLYNGVYTMRRVDKYYILTLSFQSPYAHQSIFTLLDLYDFTWYWTKHT